MKIGKLKIWHELENGKTLCQKRVPSETKEGTSECGNCAQLRLHRERTMKWALRNREREWTY